MLKARNEKENQNLSILVEKNTSVRALDQVIVAGTANILAIIIEIKICDFCRKHKIANTGIE